MEAVDAQLHMAELYHLQNQHSEEIEAIGEMATLARRLVTNLPADPVYWDQLGQAYLLMGSELWESGRRREAAKQLTNAGQAYQRATELSPDNPITLNYLAWYFCMCPDPQLRNPGKAVELASKAVRFAPDSAGIRNTLGVAYYRDGNFQAAIDTLHQSCKLSLGGNYNDFYFMSMSYWKLGDHEAARLWNNRAAGWLQQSRWWDREVSRVQEEAKHLLGF
jgi:tetratricopeptide (TPR) repeat protein